MIYLDSAATTPVADEVFEAMLPWIKDNYGNAGSIYKIGKEAKAAIEDARCKVPAYNHTVPLAPAPIPFAGCPIPMIPTFFQIPLDFSPYYGIIRKLSIAATNMGV